jgi:hypothetical protein
MPNAILDPAGRALPEVVSPPVADGAVADKGTS